MTSDIASFKRCISHFPRFPLSLRSTLGYGYGSFAVTPQKK